MAATHIVQCPDCHVSLKVPVDRTRVRCPKCETPFDIPQSTAAADARPAAEALSLAGGPWLAPAAGGNGQARFPVLKADGDAVNLAECIEPGTSTRVMLGYIGLATGLLFLTLVTYGIGLIVASPKKGAAPPPALTLTGAEVANARAPEEKAAISHRGRALAQLRPQLPRFLAAN